MEYQRMIVAIRRKDHHGVAAGAVVAKCPACQEEILLSRASQKRMRDGSSAFCSVCIAQAIATHGPPAGFEFPTLEEILDSRGLGEKN